MDNIIPSWATSSTGEGIALRWKALASGAVPALLILLPYFGFHISADSADALVTTISNIILSAWAVISGVFFVIGWVRQIIFKRNSLGKYSNQ